MTSEYQPTREQDAYKQLLQEKWMMLSEAARTLLAEAELTAYKAHLVRSYCLQLEECEVATEKMRTAANELNDPDHKVLKEIWLAALAAAASLDPDDWETPVGHRVYVGDLHYYFRWLSGMVEDILRENIAEFCEKNTEQASESLSDVPF